MQELLQYDAVIDARSEAEFAEDHLPGAVNWPSLNDDERIEVGTLYFYRWDEEIERCPISTPAIPSFTTTTGVTTYGS